MAISPADALQGIPSSLRSELLSEFDKIVRNYRERRWEPAELDGGRFCEVTHAIIKGHADSKYPPSAKKPPNFLHACKSLEQNDPNVAPHSFRILIPRLLPGLYDIRNNRGVGHVGGDVDSNQMDATLVMQVSRWILAELIRVYHSVTIDEAQQVVDGLTDRVVPVLWELPDGRIRVLKPSFSMHQRMLVVLYYHYPNAVSEGDLVQAVEHSNAAVFRRDVLRRAHKKALIDYDENSRMARLSPVGVQEVEERIDLEV